jgi:hypothetical protein
MLTSPYCKVFTVFYSNNISNGLTPVWSSKLTDLLDITGSLNYFATIALRWIKMSTTDGNISIDRETGLITVNNNAYIASSLVFFKFILEHFGSCLCT